MTREEHKQRHQMLHKRLDEIAADFFEHTGELLSNTSVMRLLEWSYEQTKNPTEK